MKIIFCDKCGIDNQGKGSGGPYVVPVKCGLHNGGRLIDLCGPCRTALSVLLNEWLATATADFGGDQQNPSAAVPDTQPEDSDV